MAELRTESERLRQAADALAKSLAEQHKAKAGNVEASPAKPEATEIVAEQSNPVEQVPAKD